MKLLLILLLFSTAAFSQDDKVQLIEQDITELYRFKKETDKKFQTIQLNLQKCQQEYKGGIILDVIAIAAIAAAIPFYSDSPGVAVGLNAVGGVCLVAGTIKIINSHKYIKRAVEY